MIAGAIAAIVIVAVVAFFLTRSKEQEEAEPIQMTTAPVREEFLTLQAWQHPPNWAVGNNALELEEAPEVGWLTDKQFRDFTMSFQLRTVNGEGAAWALRVNQDGHYLFHLSGPKGAQPNRFLTYQVNEGNDKMTQVGTPFNVVRPLVEGGVYTISIRVEKNIFNHKIRIDSVPDGEFEGEEHNLGTYQDDQDTFQSGSIGFRTFATEKFSVMDLFVYPPGTRPLQ